MLPSPQTLLGFVEGLLQWGPQAAPTNGHAADAATDAVAGAALTAQGFVTKYIKWLQWHQQVGPPSSLMLAS